MAGNRRNNGGGDHGGEERWLLPYADMITLLLGLFIVLFAMSSIDAQKFDHLKRSLSQTFQGAILDNQGGVLPGSNGIMSPNAANNVKQAEVAMQRMQEATDAAAAAQEKQATQLENAVKAAGLGKDVSITTTERGIKVSIEGDALFASGSAQIRPAMRDKLLVLERTLQRSGREIAIEGHTDAQPFPGDRLGNERLSGDRAFAVLEFFAEKGYPLALMSHTGMGSSSPVEAPPASNPQAPIAKNRRVEIILMAPGSQNQLSQAEQMAQAAITMGATAPPAKQSSSTQSANTTVQRGFQSRLPAQQQPSIVGQLADTAKASTS